MSAFDLTAADAYFADTNHTQAAVWGQFGRESPNQKTAALAEANRTLQRLLRRELVAPVAGVTFPRDDYALFEQALYMLCNGYLADSSRAQAEFVAGRTQPDDARERRTEILAPAAKQWLFGGRIRMIRG